MNEPRLADRPPVTTLCRRLETTRAGLAETIDAGMVSVLRHMHRRGVEPLGPPCVRFLHLDLPHRIDLEVGMPVAPGDAARATAPARAGTVPGGEYVEYEHVGAPATLPGAHALVRGWARDRGLRLLAEAARAPWSGVVEEILTLAEDEGRPDRWRTRIAYLCEGR